MDTQQELTLRRPRARLDGGPRLTDKEVREIAGEVELRVRVSRRTAAAIAAADPEELAQHLAVQADDMLNELCSPWCTKDTPPLSGWWQLTDSKTGTQRGFRWWNALTLLWHEESACTDTGTPHTLMSATHAWRGLRAAAPAYPSPPYRPAGLPKGAVLTPVEADPAPNVMPWQCLSAPKYTPTLTTGLHEIVYKDPDGNIVQRFTRWWNGKVFEGGPDLASLKVSYNVQARRIPGGRPRL